MKRSTKFFVLAIGINIILSIMSVWSTLLKEIRLVDLVTFYGTAFGSGASFAAALTTLRKVKKETETA